MQFNRGTKVFVMVAGSVAPGIITDPVIRARQAITKSGVLNLPEAIEVVSLRKIPNQDPFYTKRSESIAFVTPRAEHIPAVDGPDGSDTEKVIAALEREASEALLELQRRRAAAAGREVNQVDWAKVGKTALTV